MSDLGHMFNGPYTKEVKGNTGPARPNGSIYHGMMAGRSFLK
jgi:hypothetical protein